MPSHIARDRMLRMWMAVQEPRWATVAYLCTYLIAAVGGVATLLWPPATVSSIMGPVVGYGWGCILLAGGALGASVVLRGSQWVEKIAGLLILTALVMYGGTGVEVWITYGMEESRATQVTVTLIAAMHIITRLAWIWRRAYSVQAATKGA